LGSSSIACCGGGRRQLAVGQPLWYSGKSAYSNLATMIDLNMACSAESHMPCARRTFNAYMEDGINNYYIIVDINNTIC